MGFGWMLMLLGLPFLAGIMDEDEGIFSQTIDTDAAPGGLTDQTVDLPDDMPLVIEFDDTSVPHTHGGGCGHGDAAAQTDAPDDPIELDEVVPTAAEFAPSSLPMQEAEDPDADWLNTNNIPHVCYGCHDCHVQVT